MRYMATTFALALGLTLAPGVSAAAADAGGAGDVATGGSVGAASSPGPCADGKYSFLGPGAHWKSPLRWSFRASSVPSGLSSSAVLNVLKRSFNNVTGARNDCGRADAVGAASQYLGTTTRKPAVTSSGGCGSRDGHNVIGFASLGGYYSGYTCIWWIGDEIVEADMRLDTNTAWALTRASCATELMMEALVTHEVGHAYGLAHVGEARHGRLTMSVYIDGLCENQEATLGLGDLKGLEALY